MLKLPPVRYPYSYEQKVIWTDIDALGHVNHTKYTVYFENARTGFFAGHGFLPGRETIAAETGPVITDLRFAYRGQVQFPATLDVTIGVCKLTSRSFAMSCNIWDDDKLVAGGDASFLWIHLKEGRPVRLPEGLRDKLDGIYSSDFLLDK